MMVPRSPTARAFRLLLFWFGARTIMNATAFALRPVEKSIFVVFGRPGSGKTTVANEALDVLMNSVVGQENKTTRCVGLDLDVCVTQLMRDNFGKGIYPTLEERKVFAIDACNYVDDQLAELCGQKGTEDVDVDGDRNNVDSICAIVSFSFVNTDLRDIFRERFPSAEWILIDTSEEECAKRIEEREGHFYKGEIIPEEKDEDEPSADGTAAAASAADNSDWKFAPVEFPHLVLDGLDSVEDNAKKIADNILKETKV